MIDKKAYQKMDYALCLLSAHADGKDSGCIINSFHQVTSSSLQSLPLPSIARM